MVFENNPPADRCNRYHLLSIYKIIGSDFACMGSSAQHSQFIHPINENLNSSTGKDILDSIVIATSPDSWSFQHFLDRVTVVWSQALLSSFIYQKTAIVTGGDRRSEFVDKLFLEMGVKSHIHYSGAIYARELVFSCRLSTLNVKIHFKSTLDTSIYNTTCFGTFWFGHDNQKS